MRITPLPQEKKFVPVVFTVALESEEDVWVARRIFGAGQIIANAVNRFYGGDRAAYVNFLQQLSSAVR